MLFRKMQPSAFTRNCFVVLMLMLCLSQLSLVEGEGSGSKDKGKKQSGDKSKLIHAKADLSIGRSSKDVKGDKHATEIIHQATKLKDKDPQSTITKILEKLPFVSSPIMKTIGKHENKKEHSTSESDEENEGPSKKKKDHNRNQSKKKVSKKAHHKDKTPNCSDLRKEYKKLCNKIKTHCKNPKSRVHESLYQHSQTNNHLKAVPHPHPHNPHPHNPHPHPHNPHSHPHNPHPQTREFETESESESEYESGSEDDSEDESDSEDGSDSESESESEDESEPTSFSYPSKKAPPTHGTQYSTLEHTNKGTYNNKPGPGGRSYQ